MANTITRTISYENTYGIGKRNRIWIEGVKYSGTASGGLSNVLKCTALSGVAEENLKVSGTQGTVTPNWAAGTAYAYGDMVNSLAGSTTYWHYCINDGTSGGAEPTWHASENGQTADNTVRWKNINKSTIRFHNGSSYRNALVDTGNNFDTDITASMVTVNTTTNTVEAYADRGAFGKTMCWDNGDIPSGEGYEVHGFEKDISEVSNYLNVFQGNLLYIHTGTGKGQVRRITSVWDDGTDAYLIIQSNFATIPDNTSQFYILWSPMDIIYAGDAASWGIGDLIFTPDGHKLFAIRMKDHEIEIGNNGTITYFGYSGYVWSYQVKDGGVSSWGDTAITKNAEARCFFGEGDYGDGLGDTPSMRGQGALLHGGKTRAWNGGLGSELGSETRIAGSWGLGNTNITFGGRYTHALFNNNLYGTIWSYHNVRQGTIPRTVNSIGDYCFYSGGTWGGPFGPIGETANSVVLNMKGEMNPGAAPNFAGLTWLGQNTGGTGNYFFEQRNTNIGLTSFLDGDGRMCDYWGVYKYSTYKWQWIEKKSLAITVVDSKSKQPIQGATITITNQNGDIVSEVDSGADLGADVALADTAIQVDLKEKLTTGDLIRIDNEYMTLGTVSGTGAGVINVTRESRYPSQFQVKIHKYNTASFNKNIYIVKSLTTDANGQSGIDGDRQWLAFATMIADSTGSGFPSQVTKGGVNYTCNAIHQAELGTNDPPNASFWDVSGSEGFPWEDNKFYTDGADGKRSWTDHGSFPISIQKPGYKSNSKTFAPTIDTESTSLTIELERRRFIETKSREGM